jgi:hypothetical protein
MNRRGQLSLYRECAPVIDADYEAENGDSPAEVIIKALADAAGVEPVALPQLHDYIDFDAVNALFEGHDRATDADAILIRSFVTLYRRD